MNILNSFKKKINLQILLCVVLAGTVLFSGMLIQKAQAQTTYVITDGEQTITHITRSTDPADILTEAGLTLHSDDTYRTQETEKGQEIIVSRAVHVTVVDRGSAIPLTGGEETVGQLLAANGILLDDSCVLSVPRNAVISEGMEIRVDRVLQNAETYTVDIPFETSYIYDDAMEKGESRIVTPGVVGQMQQTANVIYVNQEERNRTVVEESVITQPVGQVVALGTGVMDPTLPKIGDGKIELPSGEVLTYHRTGQFVATAYTQNGIDVNDITATGTQVHVGVVAVDPDVIPYGTRMFIVTNDGTYIYGLSTAEDCGGAIQGNRLDLYFDTAEECFQFGIKDCTVYFLGDANWR